MSVKINSSALIRALSFWTKGTIWFKNGVFRKGEVRERGNSGASVTPIFKAEKKKKKKEGRGGKVTNGDRSRKTWGGGKV